MRSGFVVFAFVSLGSIFLGLAVFSERHHVALLFGSSGFTMGHVSSLIEEPRRVDPQTGKVAKNSTFTPVIDFVDGDGKPRHLVSRESQYPAAYDVGDAVRVVYDRANPDDAMEFWPPLLLLGVAGFGANLLLFGLGLGWWIRRRPAA